MTDFHSHILPGIDDGAKTLDISLKMLEEEWQQGVDTVVATPHFYADRESIDSFLARRAAALNSVQAAGCKCKIIPGAEVYYFDGVSRSQFSKLCIGNTKAVLIEMPFNKWSDFVVNEIFAIEDKGYIPILAHIERYLEFHNKKQLQKLADGIILFQSNAEFFTNSKTQKKAIKMLNQGMIHLIGSDCHNLDTRKPNLGDAQSILPDGFPVYFEAY